MLSYPAAFGEADWDGEAGENISYLDLFSSAGVSIGSNLNYESGLTYFAEEDGFVYVRVRGFDGSGGYTLDAETVDPTTLDPLDSLRWFDADNIDTVDTNGKAPGGQVPTFIGRGGGNFGETGENGVDRW